jgi:thiopeptide-type bacteriocin biosynthesis protein
MHALFSRLAPAVRVLEREKRIRWFFFMRKAPGLRLRFALDRQRRAATARITELLDSLESSRVLRTWTRGSYEPETYKFGGPDAMELAHAHFHADAAAWWRWERLQRAKATRIGPQVLSIAVLNDLFTRALDGPEEVWDVWCEVAALHGRRPAWSDHADARAPRVRIEDLAPHVSPKEGRVLEACGKANERFVDHLKSRRDTGELLYGYRRILPHLALYHWNHFGFGLEERARMFDAMTHTWSPEAVTRPLEAKA